MPDFVPRSDVKCLEWSQRFAGAILGDPQRYGIAPEAAEIFGVVQREFARAMELAASPPTRTSPVILIKNEARAAMVKAARQLAAVARASIGSDAAAKEVLGLGSGPGRSAPRPRIGAPRSRPIVHIRDVRGSHVLIRLIDSDSPDRRGLSRGLRAAVVYTCIGKSPPASPDLWCYHSRTPRAFTEVDLGRRARPGMLVWLCARWQNPSTQPGPLGPPTYAHLGHLLAPAA